MNAMFGVLLNDATQAQRRSRARAQRESRRRGRRRPR